MLLSSDEGVIIEKPPAKGKNPGVDSLAGRATVLTYS
jgi:hypothetical protein